MKITLLLFFLNCFGLQWTLAQGREYWVPANWNGPTTAPLLGANRVAIQRADSARTALLALSQVLQQQGFEVTMVSERNLVAGRDLPDSLHLKGGAGLHLAAVAAWEFPCTLVLQVNGVPNLRRLQRLSHPTAALPHGHKVSYPAEAGINGGTPGRLSQIGFDYLVAIAKACPSIRIQYLTAP